MRIIAVRFFIIIGCLLFVFGCAEKRLVFYKPSATVFDEQEYKRNIFDCKVIANGLYHQSIQGTQQPITYGRSVGAAGSAMATSMNNLAATIAAKENARDIFIECMESKGWKYFERDP